VQKRADVEIPVFLLASDWRRYSSPFPKRIDARTQQPANKASGREDEGRRQANYKTRQDQKKKEKTRQHKTTQSNTRQDGREQQQDE
jgi:hypothetical protein